MPEPPLAQAHTADRWTEADTRRLLDLFKAGNEIKAIAEILNRSRCSIYCRLSRLASGRLKGRKPKPKRERTHKPHPPCVLIKATTFLDAVQKAIDHRVLNWDWEPAGTPEPVRAWPGSLEKVEAMAARVRAGVEIWDEGDGIKKTLD